MLYMSLARGYQVNKRVDSEGVAVLHECTFQFEVPIRIEVLGGKTSRQRRRLRYWKATK